MATLFRRFGVLYVRYKDVDKKWKSISCGKGAKQADAEFIKNKYCAFEMNRHHKAPVRIVGAELSEIFDRLREEKIKSPGKAPNSIKKEISTIQNVQDYLTSQAVKNLKEVTTGVVNAYIIHRQKLGMQPKTIGEELRLFNKLFRFAIKESYCFENPVLEVKRPNRSKKTPHFFSHDEMVRIIEFAPALYADIYRFLYLTGLRIGELCNLTWNAFDELQKTLTIFAMDGNKTKRDTIVHLNKGAMEIMLKQRAKRKEDIPHVFLNSEGNQLDNDNIYRNLSKVMDELSIIKGHPHTIRHTTASHLVMKGVPLFTVSKILRHKSIRETEVYAHLADQTIKDAAEMLTI